MVRSRTTTRPPNDLVSPSTWTAMAPSSVPPAFAPSGIALSAGMADPRGWLQGDRHRLSHPHVARLLRHRLDAEHQSRALLLAVDDGRRELGLGRDEVHPCREALRAAIATDRD